MLAWCLALLVQTLLAQTGASESAPFLRLRDASLGYHGPANDFTNLTEFKIGWFGPTNLDDPLTGDVWWTVNFAISEANARVAQRASRDSDTRSLPFRLISRWAVDPWGTGVSQLVRMVYDEQPLALLGSVDSASTHLAEQVVAKAQLPLLSPFTTDKSVTLAGVAWMFACAPSDAAIARVLVSEVVAALANSPSRRPESQRRGTLVMLACTDHESRMMAREVMKEFSLHGRLPEHRFDVPAGSRGIGEHISAIERVRPDVLLIVAGTHDSARLVWAVRERLSSDKHVPGEPIETVPESGAARTARQFDWACQVFGTHAMARTDFLRLAGKHAEGVRFPLLFVPDPADAVTRRFVEQFTLARHCAPDHAAALAYDTTRLLTEAIGRAGPNRAGIREALLELSPWKGMAGPIQFDGTGQNTRTNISWAIIRNGEILPLSTVNAQSGNLGEDHTRRHK